MYELLKSLGYEMSENYRLIGRVKHEVLKEAIQEFLIREIRSKDTLLLDFSGHGIPEDNGVLYLTICPDQEEIIIYNTSLLS